MHEVRHTAGGPGERMRGAVTAMAHRLADLLAALELQPATPVAGGVAFLEAYGDGAAPPASGTSDHPVDRLTRALGLSPLEVELLALAGMPEEHEGLASVLRMLSPGGEPHPTVGLAAQLLAPSAAERAGLRDTLLRGPAVEAGVLVVDGRGPFPERVLRTGEALWPVLQGIDAWPGGLVPIAGPAPSAGLEEWLATPVARRAAASLSSRAAHTILVTGDDEDAAAARAAALVREAGLEAVRIGLPPDPDPGLGGLLCAHSIARGVVPVLRPAVADRPGDPWVPDLSGHPGPVVIAAREGTLARLGPRPLLRVPLEPLPAPARRRMWSAALPRGADLAPSLAARHALEPAAAAAVAGDIGVLESLEGRDAHEDDVRAAVAVRAGLSLPVGVRLIRPRASWEDLVLPPERLAPLREAADRIVLQGRVLDEWGFLAGRPGARGVRILLAGPPGTGKTLSAEVVAGAIGVDLLLVDIARIVSKWIGETEKNLAQVFEVAERTQAALLFDEADALFGRRTQVSDANDRYANLETAYLLTRLERFEGLAILSTNLRRNIDPAFTRRLEFVVELDEPGATERAEIWRRHLPAGAPRADELDLIEVAGLYPVVGGVIRNAAVAAGFLAAAQEVPIARRHVGAALRREYEKSGRAFPGVPAGWVT